MAPPSKSRNNKRNSSTSYASTLTTLVFIALCVFGVWMLTTNSTVSPKTLITDNTTTHTSLDISDDTTTSGSDESFETATTTNNNNSEESTESNTSEDSSSSSSETNFNTKSQNQKETTSYGDDPGNLPDDANSQKQDTIHQLSSEESSSLLTQKQEFVSNEEGLDNDQKIEQSTSGTDASEESQSSSNDEEAKSRTESQNANSSEQDVQSVDTNQVEKRNEEVEENVKQLREDKGEVVTENDEQKENPNVQDEIQETERPKTEKKRKKAKAKAKEKKAWSTQADESEGEKEREKSEAASGSEEVVKELEWHVCNVTAGADFIPCLDNEKYLKHSPRKHYEHRERHCPEDAPTCLVQLPKGYKSPIHWPSSRDKVMYVLHGNIRRMMIDVQ